MATIIILKHRDIIATISTRGAEIISLRQTALGEIMWQAQNDAWRRQSPLLFPIIGRYPQGMVRIGQAELDLPPHGFAPSQTFAISGQSRSSCTLSLESTLATHAVYPYDFRLAVGFTLDDTGLAVDIVVHNPSGTTTLPFMLGGHPGFAWPLPKAGSRQDHKLWFSSEEAHATDILGGDPHGKGHAFDGRIIRPAEMDFELTTHILPHLRSTAVGFGTDAAHVTLTQYGFEHLALWTRGEAAFFCLEPWSNLPIAVETPTQFVDLPDMTRLPPGASQRFGMTISLGGTALGEPAPSSPPSTQ